MLTTRNRGTEHTMPGFHGHETQSVREAGETKELKESLITQPREESGNTKEKEEDPE